MPSFRPRLYLPVLATALLGTLGCVDHDEADGLYVFDGASRAILVWAKPDELLTAAREGKQPPKPAKTLESSELAGATLALGGMAMDSSHKRLYLVTEKGTVHVVLRPATQAGKLKRKDDIISFKLKASSGDDLHGDPVFGPATVDPGTDTLYVMENGRDAARVWHVPNASRVADDATVGSQGHTSRAGEDRRGVGLVAGSSHQFYALFAEGDRTNDGFGHGTGGARLRQGEYKGANPAFQARAGNRDHHLLAGDATRLTGQVGYGSLAYSEAHHCVYVLAGPQPEKDPPGILVFNTSQFNGSLDQAPARRLEKVPRGLRILAHPARADWMAGAGAGTDSAAAGYRDQDRNQERDRDQDRGQDRDRDHDRDRDRGRDRTSDRDPGRRQESGGATLYLWKSPSEGREPAKLAPLAPGIVIRGLAFGDN